MNTDQVNPQAQGECLEGNQQSPLDKDIYRTEAQLSQLKEFKELREAARPLSEYLKKHFHPHTTAIVTGGDVKLVEDIKRVQF